MKNGEVWRPLLLLCLVLLLTACGKPYAVITGVVREDATGEPIEGVEVVLDKYSTRSDLDGYYSFEQVSPGIYTLTASSPNHERYDQQIILKKGQRLTNDILLKRKTAEDVSVPEQAPKPETSVPSAEVHETQRTPSLDTAATSNEEPIAVASVATVRGAAAGIVGFSACGSSDPDGRIERYHWAFGDGEEATGQVVIHIFAKEGMYHTTLTVTDNQGATTQDSVTVEVSAPKVSSPGKIINPKDYKGLQAAIDAAAPGDIILLGPQTYNAWHNAWGPHGWDSLLITKSLTLRGMGMEKTVITGYGHPTIRIRAENKPIDVKIENLTIDGGRVLNYDFRFRVEGNANLTLNRVKVWNTDVIRLSGAANMRMLSSVLNTGIGLGGSTTLFVKDCELSARGISAGGDRAGFTCLFVDTSRFIEAGIQLNGCSAGYISNCSISGETWGYISLGGSAYGEIIDCSFSQASNKPLDIAGHNTVVVKDCNFTGNGDEQSYAVWMRGTGSSVKIDDSTIAHYVAGVYIQSTTGDAQVEVRNSTIANNSKAGIWLSAGQITIENCSILDNATAGVLLERSGRGMLTGNRIQNNEGWGIVARDNAIAVGWDNIVTDNQRDLFGVTDHLTRRRIPANRSTIRVPKDAPTIQEAVYKVTEGGIITLSPGYYKERVGIYKSLTLEALDGQTSIGDVVVLNGSGHVILRSLEIAGNGLKRNGLTSGKGNQVAVEDCRISGFRRGLHLLPGSSCTILNSTVEDNDRNAIYGTRTTLMMSNCTLSSNGNDVTMDLSDSFLTMTKCIIEENEGTALEFYRTNALLAESHITANKGNAISSSYSYVQIEDCQITNNSGAGILDVEGSSLHINNSEIAFNRYGVWLDVEEPGHVYVKEIVGSGNSIHDNRRANLSPSPEKYPWPSGFGGSM